MATKPVSGSVSFQDWADAGASSSSCRVSVSLWGDHVELSVNHDRKRDNPVTVRLNKAEAVRLVGAIMERLIEIEDRD